MQLLTSVAGWVLLGMMLVQAVTGRSDSSIERPRHRVRRLAEGATESPLPIDPVLQACSEQLYLLDQQGNAAMEDKDWSVDTRSKSGKLFTKLDKSVFDKPTYKALIALLDNYEPRLGVAETITKAKTDEQSAFLDAILATPVMKTVYGCLKLKNLAPASMADFKVLLQKIWFTTYWRQRAPDTSGFEHVFVGEYQDDSTTIGLHYWVQYALQELVGKAVYKGWKGQADPELFGMQFTWNGKLKYKSTMAIGESPEMAIAVNTLCFLVAPNNECKLRMAGSPVSILSYRWTTRDPKEFYVASAYFV